MRSLRFLFLRYFDLLIYEVHEKGKKLVNSNYVVELEFVYKGNSVVSGNKTSLA